VAAVPEGASSILRGLPEDQVDRMRHQAAAFGPGALSRAADVVNAGLTDMTGATAPRLQLELIAARVLLPGAAGEQGYAARLDRLERRLDVEGVPTAGRVSPAAVHGGQSPGASGGGPEPDHAGEHRRPTVPDRLAGSAASIESDRADGGPDREGGATPREDAEPGRADASGHGEGDRATEGAAATPTGTRDVAPPSGTSPRGPGGLDLAAIRRSWPDVLGRIFRLKRSTWTFLSEHAQVVDYDGQRLVLGIATVGLANTFRNGVHAEVVRQALIDALGIDVRVEGIPSEDVVSRRPPEGDPGTRSSGSSRTRSPADSSSSNSSGDPIARDSTGGGVAGGGVAGGGAAGGGAAGGGAAGGDADGGATGAGGIDPRDVGGSTTPSTGAHRDATGASEWASRPSVPGSAPAWATGPDPGPGPASTAGVREHDGAPAEGRPSSPRSGQGSHEADDSAVSADDEDIAEAAEFGRPVVERLLGGTVIAETEE
jgi:DNA polymerase-3 subunit gamma/tau